MSHIPVKDKSNWFRNSATGSLQCADQTQYEKYMAAHKAEQAERMKMEALQKEVSELKSEMSDIKALLLTLVQKQN